MIIRNTTKNEVKTYIADFFSIDEKAIMPYPAPETYYIDIKDNIAAQEIYKTIAPYGNTNVPGRYNFKELLLVMWDGEKIRPA